MNSNVVMGPVSMEQSSVTRCVTVLTTVTRPAVSKVGTDGSVLLVLHGVNLPGLRGLWKGEEACAAPLGHAKLLPVQF